MQHFIQILFEDTYEKCPDDSRKTAEDNLYVKHDNSYKPGRGGHSCSEFPKVTKSFKSNEISKLGTNFQLSASTDIMERK